MQSLLLASACSLALFSTTPSLSPTNQCSVHEPAFVDPIKEGRDLLRGVPVRHSARVVPYVEYLNGDKGTYARRGKGQKADADYEWRTIPLSLRNVATGEVRVITITRMIEHGRLPVAILSDDKQFIVAVDVRPSGTVWNWWNTSLSVLFPDHWVVTALKWEREPSGETLITTPPSTDLLAAYPEVITEGHRHQDRDIREALSLTAHAPSKAKPGLTVAQFVTRYLPDLARSIMSVEHADPYDVRAYQRGIGSYDPLLRATAIFGLSGDEAFSATRSSVGARGVMQIMPSTCSSMHVLYPTARIPPGCATSGHSHPTEIAAGLLVADYHVSLLMRSAAKRGITRDELLERSDLQSLVLASYNGGPGRVGKFLKAKQWRTKLAPETQNYLAKYDELRR